MDFLELIGYLLGFWLFLFCKKFRNEIIRDWKAFGVVRKFNILLEAASSVFCGIVVPVWIIKIIFFG
jgi:hypothetical protein